MSFDQAWAFLRKWEGAGCVQDEHSPSCWGINLAANPDLEPEWPLTEARAREVARERYWLAINADALPPGLALMAMDAAFNQGVPTARAMLERTHDLAVFAGLRLEAYTALGTWETYGRGWVRRVADCLRAATALDAPADVWEVDLIVDHRPWWERWRVTSAKPARLRRRRATRDDALTKADIAPR